MNFEGKVFVITGSSSGMGKSCCEMLLDANSTVIGIDQNEGTIEHDSYRHYCASVLDEDKIAKCINETVD